jgi:nucleotide-binding universal stress UspA family protein
MFRHIVVALDGSKRAERALTLDRRLHAPPRSPVLLCHVVNVLVLPGPTFEPPPPCWFGSAPSECAYGTSQTGHRHPSAARRLQSEWQRATATGSR